MTEPRSRRAHPASSSSRPSDAVSTGEYVALVVLLGIAIVGAAMFVTWAFEQRGMLASSDGPTFDPDYQAPPDGTTPDV